MSKESDLEEILRLSPVGSHKDSRREIIDFPIGYLHGANVAIGHTIRLSNDSNSLPLGQHFHTNYGEIFALVQGSGALYVRVVVPGERNKIKSEIVVPEVISQHSSYERLRGTSAELSMDSTDLSKMIIKVLPGLAHTFVLSPGSILMNYVIDSPKDFDPSNKNNFVQFPLI
ncbi:hypothetical protein J4416_03875 [Candidatus Pacearchaeota archaeon]|nr:hypothetical protein [Candidatus Pacearchaeota archaeon]